MGVFVGNDSRELSLYVSFGLENSVGGKYGRSEEASFVFFVPSCLEFLSNEHTYTCWVSSLEMIQRNCLCMPALRLQLLLQQMLYVKNPNLNEYI